MRLGYLEVSWGCQDPSRPAMPLFFGGGGGGGGGGGE